jgi:hypothetical protein
MPLKHRLAFPLLVALALALPASAQAGSGFGVSPGAQTFLVGAGQHPDVAVATTGTAHVVWNEASGDANTPDPLHYCQILRGATSCSGSKTFAPPVHAIGRTSYVFTPSPGRVLIETYRCCGDSEGNYVYESTDDGNTFGPARRIGKLDHQSDAVFGPGEAISGASISEFQRMPLSGAPASTRAEFDAGFPIPTHSDVGIFGPDSPVQVMSDGDHSSFVRNTGGDPNVTANWTAAAPSPVGSEPRVAGGPAGLVLLNLEGEPGARTYVARKFDGTSFGPAVKVSETGDPIFADLWADPVTGRFHAVWIDNRDSPNELRWSFSSDGMTWREPQAIIAGDEADTMYNLQVSAAPDGQGFAVWDQNGQSGQVRAVALTPGPTIGSVGGGAGTADTPADTVTVGGQQLTLFAPGGCVNPGNTLKLRVTSKTKKKLSPKKRVKIVKVAFSLDKKTKTDKKAAFKASFSTKGLKAGSKHKLRAKILLKPVVGKGAKTTKTLKGTLTICG